MTGKVHSRESFGTVDGPGLRYVVFMQGCPMRCLYCHNPDTWDTNGGEDVTVEQLLKEFEHNKSFYAHGGITVTGGEPLLQIDFITEFFQEAKKKDIHTCIDTSGITFNPDSESCIAKFDTLLEYTDLVMLDIKHIDDDKHRALTGHSNDKILKFAKYLEDKRVPVWIRHIIVEGYTDDIDSLTRLGEFVGSLKNLKALDVLPYHTMGVNKYKELGLDYPLDGIPALSMDKAVEAKKHIIEGIKSVR